MNPSFRALSTQLAEYAREYDAKPDWPEKSIRAIADAGCWTWVVPRRWGGAGLGNAELLEAYAAIASGCLNTALILTQRDGALDLILRGENDELKERLIPAHVRGERMTSIGISQLTTSKGGGKPKLLATPDGDDFLLNGEMPWVTGAIKCDEVVTGAVLSDGRQIVASVSCDAPGVTVEPPMRFMALDASCTSRIRCDRVRVPPSDLVRRPSAAGLSMRTPVKPLVVSSVGLGFAEGIHERLIERTDGAPAELGAVAARLGRSLDELRNDLLAAASRLDDPDYELPAARIRIRVNALLTKLAIAFLTVSKGTGYARSHDAERLLREAMFFHVWSAPPDVQAGTLANLVGEG